MEYINAAHVFSDILGISHELVRLDTTSLDENAKSRGGLREVGFLNVS
jgi:hypothetical protein